MRHGPGLFLLICALSAPALAGAPAESLRPMPRPASGAAEAPAAPEAGAHGEAASALAPTSALRPMPRPDDVATPAPTPTPELAATVMQAGFVAAPISTSARIPKLRPMPRPETLPDGPERVQTAAVVHILPGKTAVFGRKGSVCGVNGIKGETVAPITSRVKGCGVPEPVRVTSVDGVQLSTPATINCPTAQALNDWVRGALKPAFGSAGVVKLEVAASYACRTRDNIKGAPISEHGRGKAIDISAIVLQNGTTVSVLEDWRNRTGAPMVKAYHAACGTFGTTLSPDADKYHRNHMHFDTASQYHGPYCR